MCEHACVPRSVTATSSIMRAWKQNIFGHACLETTCLIMRVFHHACPCIPNAPQDALIGAETQAEEEEDAQEQEEAAGSPEGREK